MKQFEKEQIILDVKFDLEDLKSDMKKTVAGFLLHNLLPKLFDKFIQILERAMSKR